jgi:hypothetical protein
MRNFKIMKNIYFLLLLFSNLFHSQILDEYPKGQTFYKDGIVNFYKEAHGFLIKSNAKECGPKEIYVPRILVTAEGKVKVVQDSDTLNISKNKCAYELSMSVLKGLKNWSPAEVKGGKFGAITDFVFYPRDLMSSYKENYKASDHITNTEYSEGMKQFDKDFHGNFMALFQDYHINGNVNIEFYINEVGEIINARIYPQIDNKDFNKDFFRALKRVKKKWNPALYSDLPIKQRVAFPVRFSINFNSTNPNDNN